MMKRRVFDRPIVLLVFCLMSACGKPEALVPAQPAFDAEYSVALDGEIETGRAIVSSAEEARAEIIHQLFYSVGQLNALGGSTDMQRVVVEVSTVTPRSDGRLNAQYRAKMLVAWPREYAVPASYTLILPAGGDQMTREEFVDAYGHRRAGCIDDPDQSADIHPGSFWYYYRPQFRTCSLKALRRNDLTERLPLKLQVSSVNTQNKSPEYGKVWEDQRLVVTAVFGKYELGGTSSDPGAVAFKKFYQQLVREFGAPTTTSLPAGQVPSVANPSSQLTFQTRAGELLLRLELIDDLSVAREPFKRRYAEAVADSDLVSYNGHSELGENIRKLVRMGNFTPGQYRIFLVNGCDTFSYVDDTLRNAHQSANPDYGPHKFFDLISNAMPSYFTGNAPSNIVLIRGLIGQRKTYRQLLAEFDISQRPVVTGEEDNNWPASF